MFLGPRHQYRYSQFRAATGARSAFCRPRKSRIRRVRDFDRCGKTEASRAPAAGHMRLAAVRQLFTLYFEAVPLTFCIEMFP